MAFTYYGDRSTDLDKVRFNIGDTVSGSGPLPSSGNFTDAELSALISEAGSVDAATALAFDAMATRWNLYANITVGPRKEELSQIADAFRTTAAQWREDHGVHSATTAGARYLTRVDGYSSTYSAGDV